MTPDAKAAVERHDLSVQWEPIDSLTPWARNTNQHPQEQVERLARVIERHGWTNPVLVDRTGVVVAGHGRLLAAQHLGLESVPVIRLDAEGPEAEAIALGDNWLARLSEEDADALAELVADLDRIISEQDDLDIVLDDLGLDIDAILDGGGGGPPADDDPPEVQEGPPDSVLGGVYELGPHRLVCGDSTDDSTWDALGIDGPVAIVTDPPYGQSQPGVPGDGAGEHAPLMRGWAAAATVTDAAVVVFQSTKRFPPMLDAAKSARWSFEAMLWLHKQAQVAFPWRGWIRNSEAVLIFSVGEPDWNEHRPFAHDTYIVASVNPKNSGLDSDLGWHGSVKPIAVVADIVCRVVRPGGQIADPFAGSGTTMMACAQEGRVARCIEIDPKYCDVIRRRYTRWAVENGMDPGTGALE